MDSEQAQLADLERDLAAKRAAHPTPREPSRFDELAARIVAPHPDDARRERERAEAFRQREAAELQNRIGSFLGHRGARYANCRLDNFSVYHDAQRQALGVLKRFEDGVSGHVHAGNGLFLFGPVGTGKDHLMTAICLKALRTGFRVEWRNGADLYGDFRDAIGDDGIDERRIISRLVEPHVLAISDPLPPFGNLTEFQASMLFRVIDGRYSRGNPTWVTFNVATRDEANKRMGAQIVDRLCHDALVVHCNWPSHRKSLSLND